MVVIDAFGGAQIAKRAVGVDDWAEDFLRRSGWDVVISSDVVWVLERLPGCQEL